MARQVELTIGVDVGGTKIAAGVVDPAGTVIDEVRVSTPATTAEAVETGHRHRRRATGGQAHRSTAVGVAIAGFVDESRVDTALRAQPADGGASPADLLARGDRSAGASSRTTRTRRPGASSASAAGGAARTWSCSPSAPVWAAASSSDDRLLRGAFGSAGEVGHVRMVPDGLPCGCGNRGCWEQYSSGIGADQRGPGARPESPGACRPPARPRRGRRRGHQRTHGHARPPPRATPRRSACSPRSAAGSGRGSPTSPTSSTRPPSSSGAGCPRPATCCSQPAREAYAGAPVRPAAHRPHLKIVGAPSWGTRPVLVGAADLAPDIRDPSGSRPASTSAAPRSPPGSSTLTGGCSPGPAVPRRPRTAGRSRRSSPTSSRSFGPGTTSPPSASGPRGSSTPDGLEGAVRPAPRLARRALRDGVTRRLGLPVVVENDANAAAWAEWRFGAGRGEDHLVCVTLGTGIGGGIVSDGPGPARPLRDGGRVRAHGRRPGRPPLRVRQPRLPGAVRLGQRPRPGGAGAGPRRLAGDGPADASGPAATSTPWSVR